ncbi:MAG: stage II sporulation protein E [Clostridiales bacterium GWB2_37_7]|nr:MAG: stage II sporulation protein E [Clostridiales bacterium GWB2_37_7]
MVDRSEVFPYNRVKNSLANEKVVNKVNWLKKFKTIMINSQLKMNITFAFLGFLLGRAVILDFLSPFGLAFIAVFALQEMALGIVLTGVLLGVFSIGQNEIMLKYFISASIYIVVHLVSSKWRINKKAVAAVTAALANFTAGYFIFYIKNYYMYDLLMIIIESFLIALLVYVYDGAFPVLKNFRARKAISSEEVVSLSILLAFSFVGADFIAFNLSMKNVSMILMIMIFSFYGSAGTGAAIGIILGLIQSLSGSILPAAIGVYGLCGLLSGVLKNVGKAGCVLAFILGNALMTFYINGSTEVLIKFYEILTAAILFMAIPSGYMTKVLSSKKIFASDLQRDKSYNKRFKEYTTDKLNEVALVFDELSATLKDSGSNKEFYSQIDAAQILDQVVSKCCSNCGMCSSCWKRDFYKSYQYLFGFLTQIENEGSIKMESIPKNFMERCIKPEEMISSIRYYYDLYRNNLNWKKKINESRMIVCEQLREVSAVVSDLALQIDVDVNFNRNLEELLIVALDTHGIYVQDVTVAEMGSGISIEIMIPACGGKRDCIKNIIPIVNKVTNKKFIKRDMHCMTKSHDQCNIRLKEAEKYQVATGIAKTTKSGAVSGDNYSFIELKDSKFMLALSDGMGTGYKASIESGTTIRLLEKFLYAGFDKDLAVRTINSLLLMKSNEETYATIDLSVINQYSGEVEFVKVGAVSTFIKYEDHVDVIKVGSLPVGILKHVDMEFVRKKLQDGDFVIMVSDGVLDSNQSEINKERWLAEIINNINTRNPQKIADEILKICLEANGGTACDDMTIMVAKIWETV